MPKAAHCSACGENVYLSNDGTCPKGHGPESLSNYYDAPEAPTAVQGAVEQPAVTQVPGAPVPDASASKSKLPLILGIIVVLLLCCGLSACGAVWFLDSDDSTSTENPLTDEEIAATEELQEEIGGAVEIQADASRMVEYFYPQYTLHEYAAATEPAETVDYHLIAESEAAPGFFITFFANRSEDLDAEGADDPTFAYVDDEAGVVWLHPETGPSGLAAWAGPSPLVPDEMRNQIMSDFLAAHSEALFMTEYNMHSNVDISLVGIDEEDLEAWYDDFTTWQSDWDNDIQAGRWVERSFSSTGE